MTLQSDLDIFLVRDEDASERIWSRQVGELASTVTRWTGNDARVVEYTVNDLRAASDEPVVRDVLDHGLTVAGSRAWLIKQFQAIPNESRAQ
jgi:hypothetical protein